jgi:acetyl-CoA synthetase
MQILPNSYNYNALMAEFKFSVPEHFNIGVACSDVPAARYGHHIAIKDVSEDGVVATSFAELSERTSRFASSLRKMGIKTGDRVAILLPQGAYVAIAHLAIYKLGAIAVPLAHVFQADAIAYRLADSGAYALITDNVGLAKLSPNNNLQHVILAQDFHLLIEAGDPDFVVVNTRADDPCLIIYTSGTTGQPKGALHAHRVLIGHLAGFELHHKPFNDGIFWTPSDWAWAGGLLNLLFPALYYGQTVIAWPYIKFDTKAAFSMMYAQNVSSAFIPPTALRMMRMVEYAPQLTLKSLTSAGESLGAEAYTWCKIAFGVQVDEFYGQTECNYILGSCARMGISKAGSIGKTLPGARVTLAREDNATSGEIIIHRQHPSMFLEYWNQPQATQDKFKGEWMLTGDMATCDKDKYIDFIGRNDDVITSSGYRIGPVEIEDCLLRHKAVALAAVIGKPDVLRTEIVKAFIVLRPSFAPNDALIKDIQEFVRSKLSSHEYPREIAFVEQLPMTTTGKIMRRVLGDEF